MKRILLFITMLGLFFFAKAAYLENVPMTLTQPDGTVLKCFASGDEFYNYLHDAQGFTIIQSPTTGFYVYADLKDGDLVPTDLIPGRSNPETMLKPHLKHSPERMMEMHKSWEIPEEQQIPSVRTRETNHGTLNNIVIFIRFADDEELTNSFASVENMFNTNTEKVSMQSYFDEVSYHQINIHTTFYPAPNGDVIVSYQDTQNRNYFEPYNATTNPNGYTNDDTEREHSLLKRAVEYINANNMIPSDLIVDYDNDGEVDNVCFVVKGGCGAWNDLLWPHMWSLYSYDVRINGKRVYTYNFQLADGGEIYFGTSTMCHEMFHSLGSPDLYHYYYGKDLNPVGKWDLMEKNATPPQHMGAYMKYKYGNWIDEIPEITEDGVYTLNDISSNTNNCYKMASSTSGQYYVFEYRKKSIEPAIYGSGLLIYRINTAANGNADYNGTTNFDEVYIYRPEGTTTYNGLIYNAAFSLGGGRALFDATTNPKPFLIKGEVDYELVIYDISAAGETISFRIGTNCDTPTDMAASIEGNEVTLSWTGVEDVESYTLYRNNQIINSSISGTTYTDVLSNYGSFSYKVTSNCSSGGNSKASNVATVSNDYPGPDITNINGDVNENEITLTWTEPTARDKELHYGTNVCGAGRINSETIYWAERFPASMLSEYHGMAITAINLYIYAEGTYGFRIYQGNTTISDNLIFDYSTYISSTKWTTVDLPSKVTLDCDKDLWIVVSNSGVNYPAVFCDYPGAVGDEILICSDCYNWILYTYKSDISWSMNAIISDDEFSHNIYSDGSEIAHNQTGSNYSYTENVNGFHEYYVTTNYFGNESQPSNSVFVPAGATRQFLGTNGTDWSTASNWKNSETPNSSDLVWVKNNVEINANTDINSLYINGGVTATVNSEKTLNITDDAENLSGTDGLVLESGANLVTNAADMQATVKRDIDDAVSKDSWTRKWHFLSSPVAAATIADFVGNADEHDYDLYVYNEPNAYWYNEKANDHSASNEFYTTNGTAFNPGRGYLTSYETSKEMSFSGVINVGEVSIPVTANSSSNLKGFNLIGNPYPCSIDWDAESGWSREVLGDYPYIWIYNDDKDQYGAYQLGNEGVGTNGVTNVIASCQGFFVKALNGGDLIINNGVKTTEAGVFRKEKNNKTISIKVEGKNGSDEVMICYTNERFNNAEKLYSRNEAVPSLYLKVDNEKYSIVNVAENESITIPMGFECGTTGKFTISSNSNIELIDKLTGNVTDLSSSSYEFYGSNADNYDRFLVRISGDSENDDFVYQNGNELIVSGNGQIQVIDCLGRVVINETVNNGRVNVSGLNTGVYVVRMENRNQKIVLK